MKASPKLNEKYPVQRVDEAPQECGEPNPEGGVTGYMLTSFGDLHGPYDLESVRKMLDRGLPATTIMSAVVDGVGRGGGRARDLFATPRFYRELWRMRRNAHLPRSLVNLIFLALSTKGVDFVYRGDHGASPDPQQSRLNEFLWKCSLSNRECRGRAQVEQGESLESRPAKSLKARPPGGPSAVMIDPVALKYRAFISYSHADTPQAKWLHCGLESFRIDDDLAGRETKSGPIPKTLKPIFRDRDDFTAGHTLTEQTLAALDASAALSSPAAANSHYVNEEIRLFK